MNTFNALVLLLLALTSVGSQAADDFPGIENLMTAAQYHASGLNNLSKQELRELNQWLTAYTANEAPIVQQQSESVKQAKTKFIASRIDGKFEGWTGKTIFRLENGQVWRQRYSGRYWYKAVDPEVEIKKNMLGFYKMKILATGKVIGVKRVE